MSNGYFWVLFSLLHTILSFSFQLSRVSLLLRLFYKSLKTFGSAAQLLAGLIFSLSFFVLFTFLLFCCLQ